MTGNFKAKYKDASMAVHLPLTIEGYDMPGAPDPNGRVETVGWVAGWTCVGARRDFIPDVAVVRGLGFHVV